jgi:hypothetical protein
MAIENLLESFIGAVDCPRLPYIDSVHQNPNYYFAGSEAVTTLFLPNVLFALHAAISRASQSGK